MKNKKDARMKEVQTSHVSSANCGPLKSLFMELNNQLQDYLDALKTASGDQNSN